MKFEFSQNQKNDKLNKIVIDEDKLTFYGDIIEGEGKKYIMTGNAVIDGESYSDFKIEFELEKEPAEESIECIISSDWEWYDYLC